MSTAVAAFRRHSTVAEWLAFWLQVAIAVSFEVFDDITRAIFSQHGTVQGIQNAKSIAAFEAAHGFFIEPAMQTFFLQSHRLLVMTLSWMDVAHFMNVVYVFCHIFCTLGVAIWVYFYRRSHFRLMRNAVMLTNLYALFVYESYPVAPPRVLPTLIVDHHPFRFLDTMYGVFNGGKIVGTQIGFNEFSAMPSVHMGWAFVASAAVVWLARPVWIKVVAALYPGLMLVSIVVTGNHFVMDAVGAVFVVIPAVLTALAYEWWRGSFSWSRPQRLAARTE
jgi:hypothetical protein